jgi:D-sedoheptulose 7-phosphate isomerase
VHLDAVIDCLERSRDTVQAAIDDPAFCRTIPEIAEVAADAQHMAAEFVGRLGNDRGPLAAVALTTDSSVLTALANNYGDDSIFEPQILGFGRRGDVLIAISTSGRSPNILRAIAAAGSRG